MAVPLRPAPKAVTDETSHDFGLPEPGENCEYEFDIRNEGDAPLVLDRGPTSCTCTMSTLPNREIPPGMAVKVKVSSKVEPEEGAFSNQARILTNDPERPEIDFIVAGRVRTVLAASKPTGPILYAGQREASATGDADLLPRVVGVFDRRCRRLVARGDLGDSASRRRGRCRRTARKADTLSPSRCRHRRSTAYYTLRLNVTAVGVSQRSAVSELAPSVVEHSLDIEFVHRVKTGFFA